MVFRERPAEGIIGKEECPKLEIPDLIRRLAVANPQENPAWEQPGEITILREALIGYLLMLGDTSKPQKAIERATEYKRILNIEDPVVVKNFLANFPKITITRDDLFKLAS